MKRSYRQPPDDKKRSRKTGTDQGRHVSRRSSNELIASTSQESHGESFQSTDGRAQSSIEVMVSTPQESLGESYQSTDKRAPLLIGKIKREDEFDSATPSIHLRIKRSSLVSNPNYVLTPFFHRGISGFAEILAEETGNFYQFAVARSVARVLLDSMGFECDIVGTRKSSTASNKELLEIRVKSFSKEKKPVQTATSARDFALLQIAVYRKYKRNRNKTTFAGDTNGGVMGEIALAFRIAAHYALSYESKMIEKSIGLRKRALMTLIVSLRGLLSQLIEQLNEGEENDSNIKAFFLSKDPDSFSDAEHLLLDIIPLLTDMSADLGSLGEKKAVSLAHNLLKFDSHIRGMRKDKKRKSSELPFQEQGRRKLIGKRERKGEHMIVLRDGLIELFFRQLLDQEYISNGTRHVREELILMQTRYVGTTSGAMTSLLPSMTNTCVVTIHKVTSFFRDQNRNMKETMKRRKEDRKTYMDKTSAQTSIHDKEDVNLLRLDGCIYLSRLMKLLKSVKEPPQKCQMSSVCVTLERGKHNDPDLMNINENSRSNKDVADSKTDKILLNGVKRNEHDTLDRKQMLCQKSFFLFHTLMQNDPSSAKCMSKIKSVKRRENLMSAVFASIMLAGKMLDTPIRTSTLQRIAKKVRFPDLSFMCGVYFQYGADVDEEKSSSSASQEVYTSKGESYEWGKDSRSLTREYELYLLTFFGFASPLKSIDDDPMSFLSEIALKLSLDASSVNRTSDVLKDAAVTYSSLCLLGEPKLIAITAYYLGCVSTKKTLVPDWEKILGEDMLIIKVMSTHMWQVMKCNKQRIKDLLALSKVGEEYHSKSDGCSSVILRRNVLDINYHNADIQIQIKALKLLYGSYIPNDLSKVEQRINTIDIS